MSDTASPARKKGCCGKLALFLAVVCGSVVAYVGWAFSAIKAPAALPFEPIAYRPLEETLLTAKFELLEGVGGLLGDSIEVELNERELNLLLFGKAGHTADTKARVLVKGDALVVEACKPAQNGGSLNLEATIRPSLGPASATVEVVDAKVGDYGHPPARWLLRGLLEQAITKARADDKRLGRLKALWVKGGKVTLIYDKAS